MRNCAIVLVVLLMASYAMAVPVITVGHNDVAENTPGQVIYIAVTGVALMDGTNINVAIDARTAGPTITSIDMLSGVYAGNNDGGAIGYQEARLVMGSVTVATLVNLPDAGTLFSITIDTTGLFADTTYDLKVGAIYLDEIGGNVDTQCLDALANDMLATLNNGVIHIIPEPATLTLLGLGLVGALLRRRS